MNGMRWLTGAEMMERCVHLVQRNGLNNQSRIWGVPRGGVPIAMTAAALCGGRVVAAPHAATIIVDDILDSGATRDRIQGAYPNIPFDVAFTKERDKSGAWIMFPWEHNAELTNDPELGGSFTDQSATDHVVRLLQLIGENPKREGLVETPARVVKAWREWASGYHIDVPGLFKTFEDGVSDGMVIVHNIPVVSKCEHHLADINGIAHVGYIPNGKIVGLSKLARVVDAFARRLQVQERLTSQIADAIAVHLSPLGVGVLIRASHACMHSRGVKVHGSVTTTSAMRGALLNNPETRAEFLGLCRDAEAHQ